MDWYRLTQWTKEDEEYFFLKLKKARVHNRPQYLRIQATTFLRTRQNDLLDVAELLLSKLLHDFPNDTLEKSPALHALGKIYQIRSDYPKAIKYYEKAMNFEKIYPNCQTTAYLDYSELIIETHQLDLYNIVKNILESKLLILTVQAEKSKVYSILSIIYRHNKEYQKAEEYGLLAKSCLTIYI